MRKLLVIGLDGATWDLIRPWADAGRLPLFDRLRREGASGPLRSVTPNLTPPGWTTAFTGVNPGKHGIFDFFTLEPGAVSPRIVTAGDRKAPALWEILSNGDGVCGVFNVPSTYPADEVKGFFITGMGTPGLEGPWVHPSEAGPALKRAHPEFRIGADHRLIERGDLEGFLDALYRLTDVQEQLVLQMVEEHDPSTLVFVYDDLDRVMHFFWRQMDEAHPRHEEAAPRVKNAILEYYRRLEQGIETLRQAMGPETDLCVLSDHGFGPLHTDVYLNRVFADWGLLAPLPLAKEITEKPLWKRAAKAVIPQSARTWLRKNVKPSPLGSPLGFVDWGKTRAFYTSVSGRSVYVNLKGRQPHGIVEPGAEYEAIRSEIKERLLGLKDPETGMPVAKAVYTREEVYHGPYTEQAPDLVIQEDGRYAYRVDWREEAFAPASQYGVDKSGSHRPLGVLILHGPSFKAAALDGARLEDVTPTLLHALGHPVGDDMDGRVIAEALVEQAPLRTASYKDLRGSGASSLGGDEEAQLAERLKGLGYM
jgi:predicted AlkP superfamily phosphohydrolase/phosphomutase